MDGIIFNKRIHEVAEKMKEKSYDYVEKDMILQYS